MDKHTEESTKHPQQKDDTEETSPLIEPTISEPPTDDTDSGDQSMHVAMEEIHLDESESTKNYQDGVCDESTGTDVCQSEAEFKDLEVTALSEEKSHPHSAVKCETKTSIDNSNSNMRSSKTVNTQPESGPSTEVINIPTHQASDTSISSSNTISNTLVKCSEPVAIPSTSRDSLAPGESSPTRPTNFLPNVKQAIHVFHPRNPTSILQRFPIPIHSGRWVYLRDSPESSDYGGSPDSLDDPFLMEALDVKTPENEMDDLYNPVSGEETPLCSPSLLNRIGVDSPSESGQVEGTIEDEPSVSGLVEWSTGDESPESGHIAEPVKDLLSESSGRLDGIIGEEPSESGHIEGSTEDESSDFIEGSTGDELSELGHIAGTIRNIPSESDPIEGSSGDEPSESGQIARTIRDLPSESSGGIEGSIEDELSESGHIIGTVVDLPFKTGHVDGDTGDELSESGHIEGSTGHLPSESGHIEGSTGDLPSESRYTEGRTGEEPSELGQIAGTAEDLSSKTGQGSTGNVQSEGEQSKGVNILIEKDPIERNIELPPIESSHTGESFGHLHSERERGDASIGNLPSESGCTERGIVDVPSDSGQCDGSIGDLSSQSDHVDESNGGIASKPDHI